MDEPTAALDEAEVATLFSVIRRCAMTASASSTSRIDSRRCFAIADRVTVLRDGATVGTYQASALDGAALIRLMVGREPGALFPKRSVPLGEVALELARVANRAPAFATSRCRYAPARSSGWPGWPAAAGASWPKRSSG